MAKRTQKPKVAAHKKAAVKPVAAKLLRPVKGKGQISLAKVRAIVKKVSESKGKK